MIDIQRKLDIFKCIILSLVIVSMITVIFVLSNLQEEQEAKHDFIMTYDTFVKTS